MAIFESQNESSIEARTRRRGLSMRACLAVLLPLLATGCASNYKPTIDGKPTARIRFITEHRASTHSNGVTYVQYMPLGCDAFPLGDVSEKFTQRMSILKGQITLDSPLFALSQPPGAMVRQGIPGKTPTNESVYSEHRVPAGESFAFGMGAASKTSLRSSGMCSVSSSFIPEANADYEAVIEQIGRDGCAMRLSKIAVSGELLPTPELLPLKELPVCTRAMDRS